MVAKKDSKATVKKSLKSKKASAKKKKSSVKSKTNKRTVLEQMNTEEDAVDYSLLVKTKHFFGHHLDNYESQWGRLIEGTLLALNLLAIVLFILDTYNFTGPLARNLFIAELVLVSIFIVEYGLRMWVARNKTHYFFHVYSLIDLVSILPVLLTVVNLSFFRIFRILRLFRLLRVLRFQRMFKSKKTLFGVLNDTEIVVIRIVLTVFTIIFMFAGLIWAVENSHHPGGFGTIWDSLYFAIVTLSTVGYGDVTPLSPVGKAITVVMILSGIALIPWQLGKLLKILVQAGHKQNILCRKCGAQEHDFDAVHCKMCGAILKHKNKFIAEDLELELAENMMVK